MFTVIIGSLLLLSLKLIFTFIFQNLLSRSFKKQILFKITIFRRPETGGHCKKHDLIRVKKARKACSRVVYNGQKCNFIKLLSTVFIDMSFACYKLEICNFETPSADTVIQNRFAGKVHWRTTVTAFSSGEQSVSCRKQGESEEFDDSLQNLTKPITVMSLDSVSLLLCVLHWSLSDSDCSVQFRIIRVITFEVAFWTFKLIILIAKAVNEE